MAVTVVDHPLIRERLTRLREESSDTARFRRALHDVARLMCFEVTRNLPLSSKKITTPLTETEGFELAKPIVLVPILRAGLGMLHGFTDILVEASIGHIGMYRDEETLEPKTYYCHMPPGIEAAEVILIDPMLATGNSSVEAAAKLKANGAQRIRFVCLIAAPEGIREFEEKHPDIPIYTATIDKHLNEHAYIVPGLGDAGDRYFGT